jgi:hypothetical protein
LHPPWYDKSTVEVVLCDRTRDARMVGGRGETRDERRRLCSYSCSTRRLSCFSARFDEFLQLFACRKAHRDSQHARTIVSHAKFSGNDRWFNTFDSCSCSSQCNQLDETNLVYGSIAQDTV